jgi:hypothetical protein
VVFLVFRLESLETSLRRFASMRVKEVERAAREPTINNHHAAAAVQSAVSFF